MRRFTTVDIDENLGDVKAAASRGPIVITEHGENRFVMLSIEDFERLRKAGVPQRAFGAGETPPEIAAPLLGFFYAKVRKTTRAKMVGQG